MVVYLKGLCMGIADVIPGVSGGTLALILGIYEELIETLSGLHLRWLGTVWDYFSGNDSSLYAPLREQFQSMNLGFLFSLGGGVVTSVILGSLIIPGLLADYPVSVRGFFFGLILGSIWIPFTLMESQTTRSLMVSTLCLILAALVGFFLSNPNLRVQSAYEWQPVESTGKTLGELLRRSPPAQPAQRIFWNEANQSLRSTLFKSNPELREQLTGNSEQSSTTLSLKEQLKQGSEPYEELELPKGAVVRLPKLDLFYVFGAGFTAISAMILPGISGSYILLILGSYFFMTFSLKSLLSGFLQGTLILESGFIVTTFIIGMVSGLIVLTRILNYLLSRFRPATLGALTGLMIGCLRGVWPFRRFQDGTIVNYLPSAIGPQTISALGLILLGCSLVLVLTLVTEVDDSPRPREGG
jgi:putative membrane protein